CHIVTGRFDLIIKLQARDNADMLRVIRDELHHLSIAAPETMVSFREAFSRSVPIANE
ncbi:MAG: Lrp/AsnC ligand binding domain-containing protein, partial [Muribaculaceae bacterium]|nr:Lrp/AsnC ligand binding domain-containing protein [Muribaculaceae bacterium]